MSTERRIKFLTRDLPFPVDPTFREYRVVQELTSVTAQEIMTGAAGIWMLPVLAIIALLRNDKNVTHEQLSKILDLGPQDIEVTGILPDEEDEASPPDVKEDVLLDVPRTGTKSTDETPEPSGTPDSPTTSPEQQDSPTA